MHSEPRDSPQAELSYDLAEPFDRVAVCGPVVSSPYEVYEVVDVFEALRVPRLVVKRLLGPSAYAMPSIQCRSCTNDGNSGLRPLELNAGGI
jgi:hypothetical protein